MCRWFHYEWNRNEDLCISTPHKVVPIRIEQEWGLTHEEEQERGFIWTRHTLSRRNCHHWLVPIRQTLTLHCHTHGIPAVGDPLSRSGGCVDVNVAPDNWDIQIFLHTYIHACLIRSWINITHIQYEYNNEKQSTDTIEYNHTQCNKN